MRAGASRLAAALIAVLLSVLLAASDAGAQSSSEPPPPLIIRPADAPDAAAEAARLRGLELDLADARLGRARLTAEELAEIRARLLALRETAQADREVAAIATAEAQRLLALLGPAPAAGAAPESAEVAAERTRLGAELARHDGAVRQADLARARAQTLIDQVGLRRRELLAAELLRHGDSPLDPREWAGAMRDLPQRLAQRRADWRDWWRSTARQQEFGAVLGRALLYATLAGAPLVLLGWLLRRRFGRRGREVAPDYPARVLAALADAALYVAAPIAAVSVAAATLIESGALSPQIAAAAGGWSGAFNALVTGMIGGRILLRPRRPGWRAVPLGNGSARRLARNFTLLAAIAAMHRVFSPMLFGASQGFGDPDIRTVYEGIVVVAVGIALALLARPGNWKPGGEIATIGAAPQPAESHRSARWRLLRGIWVALIALALGATFAGYGRLAGFILTNLYFSALVLAVLIVCHLGAREALRVLARQTRGGEVIAWWGLHLADLGLCVLALLAILPLWGVGWDEIGDFAWRSLHGMRIGGYNVSLLGFVVAIALFFAIRFVTRLVQRAFERTVLPQTRLDPGVGNSIRAGIGYVGLALALVAAMGATGLDLTSIALVAGALSVGIGFGLQNVVNNFVSGIILLVERPIKVGDWVVVGQHEGTVRRINVRATEIETFRRSTVIIPNAEFLSSSVTNWTYSDRFGRVEVRVGVAWDSDVGAVERILLDCARSDPRILSDPAPHVLLNFGAMALEFELRAVLADAATMAFVASDLRKKILAALGEAGIAIPLPVLDVHVRRPGAPAT